MDKPWWQHLLELLAGLLTKAQLEAAAPGADLSGAATTMLDLPTFGEGPAAEEARQRAAIVAFCRGELGKPYRYGTEHPLGEPADDWDCSELSHHAYNGPAGLPLPDGARFQFDETQPVVRGLAGDLHYLWSDKLGYIGHVMVDSGEGTVIHAVSGRGVVEDPIERWTAHPRYRGVRRHVAFARPPEDRA